MSEARSPISPVRDAEPRLLLRYRKFCDADHCTRIGSMRIGGNQTSLPAVHRKGASHDQDICLEAEGLEVLATPPCPSAPASQGQNT